MSENVRAKIFGLRIVEEFRRPNGVGNLAEAPKPCSLLTRESAGLLLRVLDRIIEPPLTAQMQRQFAVAHGLCRLRAECAASKQRSHFIEKTLLHHVNDSRVDRPRVGGALRQQADASPSLRKHLWRGLPLLLVFRERSTRECVDFQRANQAPRIVPMDSCRCRWVHLLQLRMKRIRTEELELRAKCRIRGRTIEQPRQ